MELVKGYVDQVTFQNPENGYTVLRLIVSGKELVCTGHLLGISQGESVEAWGDYEVHPTYGKQFRIREYAVTVPSDVFGMQRYLSSGAIKGVGEKLASRIIQRFGEDTFRIMEEEPERLAEIKGVSLRMAQAIAVQMEEKRDLRDAMTYLSGFGISNRLAVKVYEKYHADVYRILRENPYRLAEDIHGVGFRTADEIAAKVGIRADSDYRIRCGVSYVLQQATQDGHVYLPLPVLLEEAANLLEVAQDLVRAQLSNMVMDRKIIIKGEAVFLSVYYYEELSCAKKLHELNISFEREFRSPAAMAALEKRLCDIAAEQGLEMDELQMNAVKNCIQSGVFLLTGGPGTGKTTTIKVILRYFESEGMDILLAAPTGRAAKRMTETTGFEAKTIHRLLEINSALSDEDGRSIRFERNDENPLEADVVIIDETSMVDIGIFHALLKAIVPGMRLILVGDQAQLPSVGPGQVLRDLLSTKCFPGVTLQKIYRQDEGSDIVVNAHRIQLGQEIHMDNHSKDFFLLERQEPNVIYKHMIQLIRDKLPGYVNATPFDVQVLTPMRKGPLGCETLNGILQQYLNPPSPDKAEHTAGETIYRVGDKVMQIKNNYHLEWEVEGLYHIVIDRGEGVFNGDMGKVMSISEAASSLVVEFDEGRRVTYPFSELDQLELSYAITIHKSQGSEYPAVLLPLLGGPRTLLTRNLLYTGITRAKSCVTILGRRQTVLDMIANASENKRYTALAQRILEMSQDE
ncbi:MAG: ATP-dependent RecD-like DNA helicase [Lachnospiraceae bacterium]|nr:ATP-dependent RecD-like DNA helicase [Lachnospiraceae bacterium]